MKHKHFGVLFLWGGLLLAGFACSRSQSSKNEKPQENSSAQGADSPFAQPMSADVPGPAAAALNLEAWDLPAVPAFEPDARIFLIHDAHTAWARSSCAGNNMENLRATLQRVNPEKHPFWVGPDSLAPRPLDADLREGPPPSPGPWLKFLREMGVLWVALGKQDLELDRKKLEELARENGMQFLSDAWEGRFFSPCRTEIIGKLAVAVCVLTETGSPDPAARWKRVRSAAGEATWRILFVSGDVSWMKKLEALPDPPDVMVIGGMQHFPHGRPGPDAVRVAAGGDLQFVGELQLRLRPGAAPGAAFLASEAENIREERERLQASFDNLSRILAGPGADPARMERFARRMDALRAQWAQLKERARNFPRDWDAVARLASYRLHVVASCKQNQ